MKRICRNIMFLAVALAAITFCGTMRVSASTNTPKAPTTSGSVTTWDCIWMGYYPQQEVVSSASSYHAVNDTYAKDSHDIIVDSALYSILSESAGWNNDQKSYNGYTYLRMKKGQANITGSGSNYYAWSDASSYHYFKIQPIKWRVLKVEGQKAYVVADECLFAMPFYAKSAGSNVEWYNSEVRQWLNHSFTTQAFLEYERQFVEAASEDILDLVSSDYLYPLSQTEVSNNAYGFINNQSRIATSTTFAKAMGAWTDSSNGNANYWLRTSGTASSQIPYVDSTGAAKNIAANSTMVAIRPSMVVELTQEKYVWANAGTVSSNNTKKEIAGEERKHLWTNDWKVRRAATVFQAGIKYRVCTVCKDEETEAIPQLKATIRLSASKKTIKKKKTYTLKISGLAKGDSVYKVTSSKSSVASVKKLKTNQYKITGKKKGKAIITVKLKSGKIAKCTITVK